MFCSMCSSTPQPGTFAYEIFNKVPRLPTGGISELINRGGNIQNPFNNFPSQGSSKVPKTVDPNHFINNIPSESIKGSDSNLKELVDKKADGVIKKVLKSNYNDLVKKYQKDGGKWTDPDFPPEESSIGSVDERIVRATWRRIPEIIKNPEFVSGKI